MNIEELVRRSADEVASNLLPPDTDPATIRTAARRTSRRRFAAAGAVLAVGLLVASLLVNQHRDDDPGPSPVPTPSPVPFQVDNAPVWGDVDGIHVGDDHHPLPAGLELRVLAPLANGVVFGDSVGQVWFQPDSGDAVQIGRYEPRMLAGGEGTLAAWMERVGGSLELVVFDTAVREEVARSRARGGNLAPDGILNGDRVANPGPFFHVGGGLVIYGSQSSSWAYDIAKQVHRELDRDLPYGQPVDHAPGISAQLNVSLEWDAPNFFSRTVTFWVVHEGPLSSAVGVEPSGAFNHAGTRFAAVVDVAGGRHHVVVVDVGTGRVRVLTPDTRLSTLMSWGRGDELMVQQFPVSGERGKDRLLACAVSRATCRPVAFAGRVPMLPVA
ncbi:MAG: hypothetical protein ABWX84_03165 [Nocardioides sp.]